MRKLKANLHFRSGGNTDMMRKGIRILCAVCLIFSAAILTTDAIRTSVTGAETNVSPTQQAEQAPYMLGEYQGRIASYRTGSTEPMEVFDIYLDSLPTVNQQELLHGIPAQTIQELQRLIEDYTS